MTRAVEAATRDQLGVGMVELGGKLGDPPLTQRVHVRLELEDAIDA